MARQSFARFFNGVNLSRVWEWNDSGINTRLRTRLALYRTTVVRIAYSRCHTDGRENSTRQ